MKGGIMPREEQYLGFAFTRFFEKKYPVDMDRRLYTAAFNGALHSHDYPQIWYCLKGDYFHQVGDQVYKCAKGSVVIIPTGFCHKFRIREGEEAELLTISIMYDIFLDVPHHRYLNAIAALFLPSFSKELGYKQPENLMLSRASQKLFEEYMSWLSLLNYVEPGAVTKEDIRIKLEEVCSLPELALPKEYKQKAAQIVQTRLCQMLRVLSYLNMHYREKIFENEILCKFGISHTNFYQFFKRYTGYIYSQYLQMLRAKHVHIYLSRTNYSLSYISDMCGFSSTQHMSQVYKKYSGISPRKSRVHIYECRRKEKSSDERGMLKKPLKETETKQ